MSTNLYNPPFCMRCGSEDWVEVEGEYYKYICYSCGDDTTRIVMYTRGLLVRSDAKYPFSQAALNVCEKRERESRPKYWKLIWFRGSKEYSKGFSYMGGNMIHVVKRAGSYKRFKEDDFVTEKINILMAGKRPPQKILKQLIDNKQRVISSEVVCGDVAPGDEYMQVDITNIPNVVSIWSEK